MNIFITGGTSGMGAALAKLYLKEGHRVGVCGRDPQKFSQNFSQLGPELRSNLLFYQVDVSDLKSLRDAVLSFVAKDSLDLMVAGAGIPTGKKSKTPNFEVARKMIDINVLGLLNTFEVAYELMRNKGGQIAAIASVAGFVGLPGVGPYSGSKAYVVKLCESFSLDWEKQGIYITCICPGFVDTPFTQINNHKMPFLISAEEAAVRIKKSITMRKILYVFPFRMYFCISILQFIPRSIYRLIMRSKIFNYSS